MATKLYDLAIKVGEYDKGGETKGRYKNIGTVMQGEKGPYMLLDATMISPNLFMLVNKERRDSVIVSMFDGNKDGASSKPQSAEGSKSAEFNDDIPF